MIIQVEAVGIKMNKKICILTILGILIDQFSKAIALRLLDYYASVKIIDDFFYLTLVKNKGASFGILTGNILLLIIVSFIALFFILGYINKKKNMKKIESVSYSLVLGGLFGNLIDRIFRQEVIDFLDFKIFGYDYPIFNIADIFIVCGIFIIIFLEFRGEKE